MYRIYWIEGDQVQEQFVKQERAKDVVISILAAYGIEAGWELLKAKKSS